MYVRVTSFCSSTDFDERPSSMKVFVQKHAGKKQSMMLFNTYVMPLFQAADIKVDISRESVVM